MLVCLLSYPNLFVLWRHSGLVAVRRSLQVQNYGMQLQRTAVGRESGVSWLVFYHTKNQKSPQAGHCHIQARHHADNHAEMSRSSHGFGGSELGGAKRHWRYKQSRVGNARSCQLVLGQRASNRVDEGSKALVRWEPVESFQSPASMPSDAARECWVQLEPRFDKRLASFACCRVINCCDAESHRIYSKQSGISMSRRILADLSRCILW